MLNEPLLRALAFRLTVAQTSISLNKNRQRSFLVIVPFCYNKHTLIRYFFNIFTKTYSHPRVLYYMALSRLIGLSLLIGIMHKAVVLYCFQTILISPLMFQTRQNTIEPPVSRHPQDQKKSICLTRCPLMESKTSAFVCGWDHTQVSAYGQHLPTGGVLY